MALPSKYSIDKKLNSMDGLSVYENGGKGSGNWGHEGRPGYVGGSGDGKGNPDILRIVDVLKEDKSYDLHDMSPEMVVELMGEETIHKDNLEDLQHYIDRAASEMSALEAEADEEFGVSPKKESDTLKKIADDRRAKVEKLSSKENLSVEEQQELKVEQRRYAQVQMERLVKAPYHEGKGYVELDGKHFTLGEREMADAVLHYPQYIDLPMFTALRERLIKNEVDAVYNGGKGSGNFGHSGRPGEVGGSGDGGGKSSKDSTKLQKRILDLEDKISQVEKDFKDNRRTKIDMLHTKRALMEELSQARLDWDVAKRKEREAKEKSEKKQGGEVSLKGKSLYEKVHMIQPGDEVHITPKDNLPNFDRKIKVDYIQDGTIHYGSSETSDGYTYPAWAIKDITKIVRKKKNSIYAELSKRLDEIEKMINGGKGSGNFGHAGRPGEVGGSGSGKGGASREDLEREMEDASRAVMDYDDLLAEEESFGGDTSQLESARQEALDKFNEARRKLKEYDAKKEKDNIPSEIKRFEKALTDYANGDDIISIMTHKDEWEKFEKWAKKERYTKDEWEKLLASPEFGKYARDVADL